MSETDWGWVACQGKMPYIEYDHASKALKHMNKGTRERKFGIYKCPHCAKWHVGPGGKRSAPK